LSDIDVVFLQPYVDSLLVVTVMLALIGALLIVVSSALWYFSGIIIEQLSFQENDSRDRSHLRSWLIAKYVRN
jgi:hypothetical protein